MRHIKINGADVKISPVTYKKIEKIASEKGLTFAEAISLCIQKVK